MKFPSTSNTSVSQLSQTSMSKSMLHYYIAHFFQRISEPLGQDHQNGDPHHQDQQHTFNYHHSLSGLTSRIHHVILLYNPYLSPVSLISSETWCLTMAGENPQIYCIQITDKYFCESKNWICLCSPKQKFAQVLIINPKKSGITHPQDSIYFSHAERGGRKLCLAAIFSIK